MSIDFALILRHPDLDTYEEDQIADYYTQDKPLSKYIWLDNISSGDLSENDGDVDEDIHVLLQVEKEITDELIDDIWKTIPENWKRWDHTACGVEIMPGDVNRNILSLYLRRYKGWYIKSIWD